MQFHAAELIRWEAEPEHQDYLERYPHGYTCHYVRPDWKLPQAKLNRCEHPVPERVYCAYSTIRTIFLHSARDSAAISIASVDERPVN